MPKYKNISGKDLWLPGIGNVKADETTEQPDGFNNANFETVGEAEDPQRRGRKTKSPEEGPESEEKEE